MRYPASEKLEIIRLVEQLPPAASGRTLDKLGIPKTTFYQLVRSLSGLWRRRS